MVKHNVDDITNILTTSIIQMFDECAPMVRKRISRNKSPCSDSNVEYLSQKKNKPGNDYLSFKTQKFITAYCKAHNELNAGIKSAKIKNFRYEKSWYIKVLVHIESWWCFKFIRRK